MQFQGLVRDHKQQYSLSCHNLAFKWKQPLGQQNTRTPLNHIKEKCLLVARPQGRKVNALTKDIENYTARRKFGKNELKPKVISFLQD